MNKIKKILIEIMSNNKDIIKKNRYQAKSVVKAYKDEKNDNSNHNSFVRTFHPRKSKNKFNSNLTIECINKSNEKSIIKKYTLTNTKKESYKPKKILDSYGLNTSFNLSNINNRINSSAKKTPIQVQKKSLFFNNITNNKSLNTKTPNEPQLGNIVNHNNSNNFNDSFKFARRKNTISYVDRKKIKKLNSTTLKLYEIYLQRKNQALKDEESLSNKDNIFNKKTNYIFNNLDTINGNSFLKSNKNLSIYISSSLSKDYSLNYNKYKKKI